MVVVVGRKDWRSARSTDSIFQPQKSALRPEAERGRSPGWAKQAGMKEVWRTVEIWQAERTPGPFKRLEESGIPSTTKGPPRVLLFPYPPFPLFLLLGTYFPGLPFRPGLYSLFRPQLRNLGLCAVLPP